MNRNRLFFFNRLTWKSLFGASTVPERELYFDRSSKSGFGASVVCLPARANRRPEQIVEDRAKKLVKVCFNGRALEKARKVEWEWQAFILDESELAESDE